MKERQSVEARQMKERGILFSAPMVRSILAGTKSQTRRAVKPQPQTVTDRKIAPWDGDGAALQHLLGKSGKHCPYGQPGDRLWVRESFGYVPTACGSEERVYAADYTDGSDKAAGVRHKPSIHMPRAASRITLELTGVRVERLQDISEADAIAEGVAELPGQAAERGCWWTADVAAGVALHGRTPCTAYRLLWEQINGPGSWAANPWVWVVEFKRIAKEDGAA